VEKPFINRACVYEALLCCAVLTAPAFAQDDTPVFRTTSELVLLDIQVVHQKTATSTKSVRREDLQVFEDGKPQIISFFSRDELPLSIVMLFDMTATSQAVLKQLAAGARSALSHLKPADEVAVMVYAAHGRVLDGFTTNRDRTAAAIERAAGEHQPGGAFFNEAVWEAADLLNKSGTPSGRRVVIWLTDNLPNVPMRNTYSSDGDTLAVHTESEAIRSLHESGTVVAPLLQRSALAMGIAGPVMAFEAPFRHSHPPGDAHKYAELTGGEAIGLGGKQVDERLSELIDDLRSRYTIGYPPTEEKPPGTFCKVKVTLAPDSSLRPQEWKVLARAGYYRKPPNSVDSKAGGRRMDERPPLPEHKVRECEVIFRAVKRREPFVRNGGNEIRLKRPAPFLFSMSATPNNQASR
jgi:VWFA-related protein